MHCAKIIGTGSYLPKKILSNHDLEKMVETSDDWIVSRTGISERRIAASDEYTSDMGAHAAVLAIKNAKIDPKSIDCILVATLTPDYIFPSTACLIQNLLHLAEIPALDIQAACSGYLYGLALAKTLVEAGKYHHVLLVASEKLSTIVDYQDRSTCVLFGDGASAAVISCEGNGFEISEVTLGADGTMSDLLILPAGGSRFPASEKTLKEKMHFLKMEGNEVFKHAVRRMEQACKACLKKTGFSESDVSYLIPHQANSRIIDAIAKRFPHLPENRVYKDVVKKYGNTSASSIGIALDEIRQKVTFEPKEHILLCSFGAGLTWAAALLTQK